MTNSNILVTGCAGFIGMKVIRHLLDRGENIIGVDNLNAYYDQTLKECRLAQLQHPNFHFYQIDISDRDEMERVWKRHKPKRVIHLAAQAGVRYSIDNPFSYVNSNMVGFLVMLELCRHQDGFEHFVYASSSSVYGDYLFASKEISCREDMPTTMPSSLYAATKASNELMAQSYAHLYHIPMTGLRFFTVYGPWGRPDMAYFKFTKAIIEGKTIDLFNDGKMKRDFTYIDDVINGIVLALDHHPLYSKNEHHPIYNLGNNQSEDLLRYIQLIEQALGKKAIINFLPMQPGDVPVTYASIDKAQRDLGYSPQITIDVGIPRFVEWYQKWSSLENPWDSNVAKQAS